MAQKVTREVGNVDTFSAWSKNMCFVTFKDEASASVKKVLPGAQPLSITSEDYSGSTVSLADRRLQFIQLLSRSVMLRQLASALARLGIITTYWVQALTNPDKPGDANNNAACNKMLQWLTQVPNGRVPAKLELSTSSDTEEMTCSQFAAKLTARFKTDAANQTPSSKASFPKTPAIISSELKTLLEECKEVYNDNYVQNVVLTELLKLPTWCNKDLRACNKMILREAYQSGSWEPIFFGGNSSETFKYAFAHDNYGVNMVSGTGNDNTSVVVQTFTQPTSSQNDFYLSVKDAADEERAVRITDLRNTRNLEFNSEMFYLPVVLSVWQSDTPWATIQAIFSTKQWSVANSEHTADSYSIKIHRPDPGNVEGLLKNDEDEEWIWTDVHKKSEAKGTLWEDYSNTKDETAQVIQKVLKIGNESPRKQRGNGRRNVSFSAGSKRLSANPNQKVREQPFSGRGVAQSPAQIARAAALKVQEQKVRLRNARDAAPPEEEDANEIARRLDEATDLTGEAQGAIMDVVNEVLLERAEKEAAEQDIKDAGNNNLSDDGANAAPPGEEDANEIARRLAETSDLTGEAQQAIMDVVNAVLLEKAEKEAAMDDIEYAGDVDGNGYKFGDPPEDEEIDKTADRLGYNLGARAPANEGGESDGENEESADNEDGSDSGSSADLDFGGSNNGSDNDDSPNEQESVVSTPAASVAAHAASIALQALGGGGAVNMEDDPDPDPENEGDNDVDFNLNNGGADSDSGAGLDFGGSNNGNSNNGGAPFSSAVPAAFADDIEENNDGSSAALAPADALPDLANGKVKKAPAKSKAKSVKKRSLPSSQRAELAGLERAARLAPGFSRAAKGKGKKKR